MWLCLPFFLLAFIFELKLTFCTEFDCINYILLFLVLSEKNVLCTVYKTVGIQILFKQNTTEDVGLKLKAC